MEKYTNYVSALLLHLVRCTLYEVGRVGDETRLERGYTVYDYIMKLSKCVR